MGEGGEGTNAKVHDHVEGVAMLAPGVALGVAAGVAAGNGGSDSALLLAKNSLTSPIMTCNHPEVANMPPTIPMSRMRNWRSGFLFSTISTTMGDISYLKKTPGTP